MMVHNQNVSVVKVDTHVWGHWQIESSHSLHQNDAKLQTHPPSTLNVKIPNLPEIDIYDLKYKIIVRNIMKLPFFDTSA